MPRLSRGHRRHLAAMLVVALLCWRGYAWWDRDSCGFGLKTASGWPSCGAFYIRNQQAGIAVYRGNCGIPYVAAGIVRTGDNVSFTVNTLGRHGMPTWLRSVDLWDDRPDHAPLSFFPPPL